MSINAWYPDPTVVFGVQPGFGVELLVIRTVQTKEVFLSVWPPVSQGTDAPGSKPNRWYPGGIPVVPVALTRPATTNQGTMICSKTWDSPVLKPSESHGDFVRQPGQPGQPGQPTVLKGIPLESEHDPLKADVTWSDGRLAQ